MTAIVMIARCMARQWAALTPEERLSQDRAYTGGTATLSATPSRILWPAEIQGRPVLVVKADEFRAWAA